MPRKILIAGLILAGLLVAVSLYVNRHIEHASFDGPIDAVWIGADSRVILADDRGVWLAGDDLADRALAIGDQAVRGRATAFSADGRLAAIDNGAGSFAIWSLAERRRVFESERDSGRSVSQLAWSLDGRYLAVDKHDQRDAMKDRIVEVWDLSLRRQVRTLPLADPLGAISWSQAGLVLPALGGIQLIDAPSGRLIATLDGYFSHYAWSPDGRWLATDQRLWRYEHGLFADAGWLAGPEDEISALRFSPDSSLLVAGTGRWQSSGGGPHDTAVYVWRVADRRLIKTFDRHDWIVGAIAISPDNSAIVTGDGRGEVYLWRPVP